MHRSRSHSIDTADDEFSPKKNRNLSPEDLIVPLGIQTRGKARKEISVHLAQVHEKKARLRAEASIGLENLISKYNKVVSPADIQGIFLQSGVSIRLKDWPTLLLTAGTYIY